MLAFSKTSMEIIEFSHKIHHLFVVAEFLQVMGWLRVSKLDDSKVINPKYL